MNTNDPLPEIDEEHATLIDCRLAQSFTFLADALENPMLHGEIPGGAKVAFHTMILPDSEKVRLTAFRVRQSRRWQVRVTSCGNADQGAQAWWRERPFLWQLQPLIDSASWGSAASAFAALNEALRRGTEEQRLAGLTSPGHREKDPRSDEPIRYSTFLAPFEGEVAPTAAAESTRSTLQTTASWFRYGKWRQTELLWLSMRASVSRTPDIGAPILESLRPSRQRSVTPQAW